MDKYYYLVAQLPALHFNREAPITVERFFEEAAKWLSPKDLAALREARLDLDKGPSEERGVLRRYREFHRRFRRELGEWRQALREGYETRPETFSPSLVKEGNPLEIERKLLARQWEAVEEEEMEHHFDLDFLILYYLKLQILERLAAFDAKKGKERFEILSKTEQ